MGNLSFDIAHLFAGSLVLVSFMLLYQDRMSGLINIFTVHAVVLSFSVGWQAYTQHAPHLFVTAAIAVIFKALIIPISLQRIMVRLRIHRDIEIIGGVGVTMLVGHWPRRFVNGRHAAGHGSRRSAGARRSRLSRCRLSFSDCS